MDVKYLKRVYLGVLTVLCSIAVIAYLLYHVSVYFKGDIETSVAQSATESHYLDCDGYIFRDETVIKSTDGGTVSAIYGDGEKVSIGSTLVNVYQSEKDLATAAGIAKARNQIEVLKSSGVTGTNTDVTKLTGNIESLVADLRSCSETGNAVTAVSSRDDLLISLNRLQVLTGSYENYDAEIESLNNRIDTLIASLGPVNTDIAATESGYFYSRVDGCEGLFTSENAQNLTVENFDSYVAAAKTASVPANCVGKLADSFKWYIAVSMEKIASESFSPGDVVSTVFRDNGDENLSLTVEKVLSEPGNDRAVVLFVSYNTPSGFVFSRCQRLRILEIEYDGYRVPVSGVRVVDGEIGVYILDGGFVRFKKIKIIYRTEGYLIVAPSESFGDDERSLYLKRNDSIITKGKELYDGKVIVG